MKRFLLAAVVFAAGTLASVPAFAQDYIVESRKAGGAQNTPDYTHAGPAVTSAKSTAAGLTGTGSYYAGDTSPSKWGNWAFTPPAGKSGYYKVYGTWAVNAYAAGIPAPTWTVHNAGSDVTIAIAQTSGQNAWNELTSAVTEVQLTDGVAYSTQLNTAASAISGKRTYFDSVKWVYQRTNTPTLLTATIPPPPDDGTRIDLAWVAPTPAPASYTIERKEGMSSLWPGTVIATGVTTTTYVDTDNVCGINYYYRVNAVDSAGVVSGWSNEANTMKCFAAAPGRATNPSPADLATLVHTDIAELSWTADINATSHDVWFGKTSGGMTLVSAAQTGTTYAQGTLDANQDYFWRIDETNLTGTATGDVWTFKTGVSLTVIAIRKAAAGNLSNENSLPRAWSTTTWHEAGTGIGLSVTPNEGYTWKWWTKNIDGTKSTWVDPPYGATWSDENQVLGRLLDPVTAPYYVGSGPGNDILYAYFEAPQFTVSLTANPVAGQTSLTAHNNSWPPATTYEAGDSAHLQTTPAAGYLFAGWESDQAGVFANVFAADTTYTFAAANTAITAYYAHAVTSMVDTSPLSIYASDLAGTNDNSSNVQVNVGAYTNTNGALWARIVCNFPNNIPAQAVLNGLGKLAVHHIYASSYSSTSTLQVSAYPITTSWKDGMVVPGATWVNADRTVGAVVPWTTPGGDMGACLGTQPMYGTVDEWKIYPLPAGTDYRTLLANGILLKGDVEGNIAYRKGVGKDVTLSFFYDPPTGAAEAKELPDGEPVSLSPEIVTTVVGDGFYMEESDRSSGIKVLWSGSPVSVGDLVNVAGDMATNTNFERQIVASSVTPGDTGSVEPLLMTNKDVGGGDWFYDPVTGAGQKGVLDGAGLNNIGLLVRTTGAVAAVGLDYIIINDGSDARGGSVTNGIRISCAGLTKPVAGQSVTVTGISTINNVRGNLYRCILVTTQDQISINP